MNKQTLALLTTAFVIGAGAAYAYAASPAGIPNDPYSNENKQPGPNATTPADPAAGAQPGARIPTSPPGTDQGNEGGASGESGADSPAGIPADPYSNENKQPGPSGTTPSDPDAGSKPGAQVPTSPPGTAQ